jgi:molecular chaperone DnaK
MKTYSPPEISAMILAKLKCDAEAKLGETITQAIITVPAYFNNSQRTATRDAGKMAGLEVLRIISDPVAAALAYGSSRNTKDGMIAFYDLGGGNFSTAVIECGDGIFEVKATNGDTHLGGDDWDSLLMDWIINDFRSDSGIDLTGRADALFRIKVEAENAKIALSSSLKCDIRMPFITSDASGSNSIEKTLARLTMERLTSHPLERSLTSILDCFNDAGISADKIHEVVIAGGMTRMPGITMAVERLTGKVPYQGINPDEAVAIGAAIQGGVFMGEVKDVLTLEVTPLTLAIETAGGVATAMIPRNTTVPTRRSAIFSTDRDNQTSFEVKVLEGERPLARDNVHLGTLQLDGILPAPRGAPQIEVTFDIDANGITHVGAKDLGSGREQKLSIAGFSNT